MLLEKIDESEFITVLLVKRDEFYDFREWQDMYYITPTGGDFNQSHIFTIYGSKYRRRSTVMVEQDNHGTNKQPDDLIPNIRSCKASIMAPACRVIVLKNMTRDSKMLKMPGINPIEQVELYQKWGPFISGKARSIIYTKLSDDIMKKVKHDKAANRKAKKKNREESTS